MNTQNLIDALEQLLTALKQEQTQENKPVLRQAHKIKGAMWQAATTTEVSHWTYEMYDWKPLLKYCKDNGIEVEKKQIGQLNLNNYPAEAWWYVYGILLGNFN